MPSHNWSRIAIPSALVLVCLCQVPGRQHAPIRIAAADSVIQQDAVQPNIISSEPAHPTPGRIDTAPVPPPAPEPFGSVTPADEVLPVPASTEPSANEVPAHEVTPELPQQPETTAVINQPVQTPAAEAPGTPATPPATVPPGGEVRIGQGPAGVTAEPLIPIEPAAPDEAPLWELFNAHEYRKVFQEISRLRAEYPEWPPPEHLLALTNNELTQADIREAIAAGDPGRLTVIAQQHRGMFSCSHLDWAWSLVDAYASLGRNDELFDVAGGLIDKCAERERLVTLQKAIAWLDADAWDRLAQRESARPRTQEVDAQFRRLRYDHDIKQLLLVKQANDPAQFIQSFNGLAGAVEYYRDVNIALLAGWSFLEIPDLGNAALWFGKAQDWHPDDVAATHGLALCALAEKRFTDARRLADKLPDGSNGKDEILHNAIIGMAQQEYAQNNYAATLQLLNDAGNRTDLPRYARLMAAWSLLHTGNSSQALELFQQIHNQQPDAESAQGIFNTMITTRDIKELDCSPDDQFLRPLFQTYCADQSFTRKRFLTAGHLAPQRYGSAGSSATPRLAWYLSLRDKTGSPGLSKLNDVVNSFEAAWKVTDRSEIYLRLDHHYLDSDLFAREARQYLARGLLTGALGIPADSSTFAALAETGADTLRITGTGAHVNAWEPHITWRSESRFDVEADIGLSVLGGAVDPHLMGHLSLADSGAWGSYKVTGYTRPVRESILSYTGWRLDQFLPNTPFNGRKWGGVRGVGAELSGYLSLGNNYGFNGKIAVEQIDAHNVHENIHESLLAGINRNLALAGFDYFAAGISAAYDHYQHNLSQFTPGHGGYFSPQSFLQLKANLDFLTMENRKAILKGHLDAGRVFKREATTPIIPLSGYSDFGNYPGSREWGWAYTVELEGAVQLSKHVQMGTQISYRAAPQYNETAAMLFVRVLFDARTSVLSSDLAGRVLDAIR